MNTPVSSLVRSISCIHTHTQAHTHAHTCAHTYLSTHTHILSHSHAHTPTHAPTDTRQSARNRCGVRFLTESAPQQVTTHALSIPPPAFSSTFPLQPTNKKERFRFKVKYLCDAPHLEFFDQIWSKKTETEVIFYLISTLLRR